MLHSPIFRVLTAGLVLAAVVGGLAAASFGSGPAAPASGEFPGITLGLTAEARESLQDSEQAFPSDEAGFSTYYQVPGGVLNREGKDTVDNYIFGPVQSGSVSWRAAPATISEMGDNYTVAEMPLLNIDNISSTANIYYDDQGWVIAFLPRDAPSSQVWQARTEDTENPELTDDDLGNTLLLDAINVVVAEALGGEAITPDSPGLGYYHFKYPAADSFLMMAAARGDQGEYPISFTVPDTLTVKEVSATMWITEDANQMAPHAKVVLDDADLIAERQAKGIYSNSRDLVSFGTQTAHSLKLTQSMKDNGASGVLLMIVYDQP